MDFFGESLLCKAKSIVSSLSEIMLWVSKLPSSIQTPKEFPTHHDQYLQLGLKTLVYPQAMSLQSPDHLANIVHSKTTPAISPSSSSMLLSPSTCSSSGSSTMDDLIGTESGVVYLSASEYDIKVLEEHEPYNSEHVNKLNRRCAMTKNFPPPVPPLPWVFTRHYTDGKLILEVERVKHYEYFEARRENGRLVLNLVQLDDNINYEENEELELEDLQLVEDQEVVEKIEEDGAEEHQETEADYDGYDHKVNENLEADFATLLASSMPGNCLTVGMVLNNSSSYCNANKHEHVHAYLALPGSAPLCPVTTVV
ncbi:uncharacterized protein LOC126708092 [Quercus robur]|uniref:uncharacterized protein LOC126708092 n=1 Tax=Quercus robur TaxID=38942 RepID=UPI0021620A09|nr:uncharacterized protein LOC126708092 [Quercus robur]